MASYQPRDKYYRRARAKGLRSRAAFKLEELLSRYRLAGPGMRVLDLGCAPGGWLLIVARAVGPAGKVVGIDLVRCLDPPRGVTVVTGDLADAQIRARALQELGGAADLITSDLAPKLTGISERDQALSADLIDLALSTAMVCLKPGGAMVAKLFMNSSADAQRSRFQRHFGRVELARTAATRPGSAELYLVARNFHPRKNDSGGI